MKRESLGVQMIRESSRKYLIISIVVESTNLQTQNVTKGKLSFDDLAGSERCVHWALNTRLAEHSLLARIRIILAGGRAQQRGKFGLSACVD